MEPLHASNRRLVHKYIENETKLKTMTVGDGEYKKVVILPAEKSNSNNTRNRRRKKRN